MTGAERQRRWRENKPEKAKQAMKDRYQARKKRGVCNQCGRPSAGLAVCRDCLDKRKKP